MYILVVTVEVERRVLRIMCDMCLANEILPFIFIFLYNTMVGYACFALPTEKCTGKLNNKYFCLYLDIIRYILNISSVKSEGL
jgi:hypothetical protein